MIDAAIILAGGKGSRLAPWPAPKCLLPVNGVPIIERLIAHVEPHVKRVVVCVGYRSGDVERALRRREEVRFSNAGDNAAMGARLLRAREDHRVEGRALVLYGDELNDVDVGSLVHEHDVRGALLTFTGYYCTLPFGVVHGSRIGIDEGLLVNIGYVLIDPLCWTWVKEEDGLAHAINRVGEMTGKTACYIHEGRRATINNLLDLSAAELLW